MKFKDFLKSKALALILWIVSLIFVGGVLNIHSIKTYSIVYILLIISAASIIPLIYEFFKKRDFYNCLNHSSKNLDRKFLLSEVIEKPEFFEGEMFFDVLKSTSKSMNDEIAKYRIMNDDYREYIEKWVHEIKTPIAACKLAAENRSSSSWEEISEDLDRIEAYVEQTLFYSRISNAEKDYFIKEKSLNEVVAYALKANARMLIKNGFSIKRIELDLTVMTDEKWIGFILEQIISNSVKYKTSNPIITFQGVKKKNGIALDIIDNGIGISNCDLPRIFEKNFTGGNGRLNRKATGFGLYLCKKLCDKMGLEISASSDNGTTITIFFPKNKLTSM